MKLIANGETFQAEKIIKTVNNIIGYDSNGNEIFSFKGVSDFTGFQLQDDNGNIIELVTQPGIDIKTLQDSIAQAQINIDQAKGAINYIVQNY